MRFMLFCVYCSTIEFSVLRVMLRHRAPFRIQDDEGDEITPVIMDEQGT